MAATSSTNGPAFPALDDVAGWREHIEYGNAMILSMFRGRGDLDIVNVETANEGEAVVYFATPRTAKPSDGRIYLEIHGGALIMGGGEICRNWAVQMAARTEVEVCSVDYRMPPEHPYPAGLDDCLAIYRRLLRTHRPEEIIVQGGSAGGNLAAAMVLRARDEGLPLPSCVVLLSPEVDLTESGDSFWTNLGVDGMLQSLTAPNQLYANGHDLREAYLSPLFGDFTKGFPPTFLSTGTRDLFLSNTVRMHRALRRAGVEAELHVIEAASHGGFGGYAPEDHEILAEAHRFAMRHATTR